MQYMYYRLLALEELQYNVNVLHDMIEVKDDV